MSLEPEVAPPADEAAWQRLSPRNLLIDPVKVLGQFAFPAVIALVGLSQGGGGMPWWALPIVVVGAVAFGVLPWLTTFYRTTETQFQTRSGLLNKKTKTAPLDRVRSVDLEASLLHRVVGLTKALAVEHLRTPVRVNCVCPGGMDTPQVHTIDVPEGADFDLIMRVSAARGFMSADSVAGPKPRSARRCISPRYARTSSAAGP